MSFSELFSDKTYPNLRSYTILLASLIGGIFIAFNFFDGGKNNSIGTDDNGAIIINNNQFIWAHSPSELWEKSPIFVEKGIRVSIITSGKYCTNIDSLTSGHHAEYMLNAGGKKKSNRDSLTNSLLTYKKADYGQLMFQIVEKNNTPKIKPNKEIVFLLENGKNELNINSDGYLWFSTNHPSLSPYGRQETQVYNNFTGESISQNKLKNKKYEPFYEDNFGQILMQISIVE